MIQYLYLGRVGYDEALRLQAEVAELRHQQRIGNILLLLEHPPVITLGRNAHRSNVLASDELLASRGIVLHDISRGGDVTYHGPGQLVGYPIFDLRSLHNATGSRLGPVDFVRMMEEALIRLCAKYGVPAGRIKGLTGVWCPGHADQNGQIGPEGKVCAIGIHVSRGITSHGFAFNVTTDMRDFRLIIPCGIVDHSPTSLDIEIAANGSRQPVPALEAVAHEAARQFGQVFGEQMQVVESMDALRAQAAKSPEFPAEDTPLQVPPEVERLAHVKDRPTQA
jgi:lipoyl(octanoyl) transferase